MAARNEAGAQLQRELLRLLRPRSRRRDEQLSERVRPRLDEIARNSVGRPAQEVASALADVVRAAGGTPDPAALAEFAEEISTGGNPFA
jgi:hypothetical protein